MKICIVIDCNYYFHKLTDKFAYFVASIFRYNCFELIVLIIYQSIYINTNCSLFLCRFAYLVTSIFIYNCFQLIVSIVYQSIYINTNCSLFLCRFPYLATSIFIYNCFEVIILIIYQSITSFVSQNLKHGLNHPNLLEFLFFCKIHNIIMARVIVFQKIVCHFFTKKRNSIKLNFLEKP